jgi:hypothetical protein
MMIMSRALLLAGSLALAGCGGIGSFGGPYGNGCPAQDPGWHYCGLCSKTNLCHYCQDVNGQNSCADACSCGVPGGGGAGGSGGGGAGGSGGGGSGGSSGGGGFVCNSTCPAQCPAGSDYQCSQYVANGRCSIQSCTCYYNTPTAYCGIFYRSSTGSVWWCGGGYNMSCSSIPVQQCAYTVTSACQ